MNIEVKVIGENQLSKLLQSKAKNIDSNLERDITKCCLKVEADAKKKCPVSPNGGRLRSSITSEVKKKGFKLEGRVGTNVEYASYVEYGTGIYAKLGSKAKKIPWTYYNEEAQQFFKTSGMQPKPYLYPALRDNFEFIQKKLGKSVIDTLKKKI